MRLIALALPLLFLAAPAAAQTADAAQVVAAERAFAADGALMGITASFTKWSTPDAIVIGGGQAQTVREGYPPDVPRPADEPLLAWWPNFAGISMSGDLGFTTGGVSLNGARTGHYFTMWKRQPDGSWKWVYDGGSGASAAAVPGPESDPVILPTATVGSASPGIAMAEVEEAEAGLAAQAASSQKAAHLQYLAADGRLYVAPRPPALGAAEFPAVLDGWPATFAFGAMEGGGASDAGDMVWTYGPASWSRDGQPRHGHYVRIWQKRPEGWRIVLAQLIPAPPPPPPPTPVGG
ncbi:MAG: DUF4440 domain-containing protein [Pseudomonadota bacterium]